MALLGACYSCTRQGWNGDSLLLSQSSGDGDEALPNEAETSRPDLSESNHQTDEGGSGDTDTKSSDEQNLSEERNGGKAETRLQAGEELLACFVHICGAVKQPGVYEIPENSRVYQAIEAAGGFLPEADEGYLNLAALIADGMKITVYTKEESETAPAWESVFEGLSKQPDSQAGKAKVNINTADTKELTTLRGIGESRANDIIAYREKHGLFSDIEEIMQVPGIKDGAFQKIKDDITVQESGR
jgi:competence protein ComEA